MMYLHTSKTLNNGPTEHCENTKLINFKYSSSNPQTNYRLPGNTTAIQPGCCQQRVSGISGMEWWNGLLEWNTGIDWDKIFALE